MASIGLLLALLFMEKFFIIKNFHEIFKFFGDHFCLILPKALFSISNLQALVYIPSLGVI